MNTSGKQTPALYNPNQLADLGQLDRIDPVLIQPKMTRTKTQKGPINMEAISSRINQQNMIITNRVQTAKGTFKAPHDSITMSKTQRNMTHRSKISKTKSKKRASSKGSNIEGKLNEDDMLPLAKELTDEELSRYQIGRQ